MAQAREGVREPSLRTTTGPAQNISYPHTTPHTSSSIHSRGTTTSLSRRRAVLSRNTLDRTATNECTNDVGNDRYLLIYLDPSLVRKEEITTHGQRKKGRRARARHTNTHSKWPAGEPTPICLGCRRVCTCLLTLARFCSPSSSAGSRCPSAHPPSWRRLTGSQR